MPNHLSKIVCICTLLNALSASGQSSDRIHSFTLKCHVTNNGEPLPAVKIVAIDQYHDHILMTPKNRDEGSYYTLTFNACNSFDSIPLYGDYQKLKNKDFPLSSDFFNALPRYLIRLSKAGYQEKIVFVNVYFDSRIRDSILKAEGTLGFNAELDINMEPLKNKKTDTLGVLAWNNSARAFKLKQVPFFIEPLPKIKKGEKIILKQVYFEAGSSVLLPKSYPELNKLLEYLKGNKDANIEISGHTDTTGYEESNKQLSKSRAKVVADYLLSNGIVAYRVSFSGYGSSKAIASNETEEGRQQNRRVEFVIK